MLQKRAHDWALLWVNTKFGVVKPWQKHDKKDWHTNNNNKNTQDLQNLYTQVITELSSRDLICSTIIIDIIIVYFGFVLAS